MIVISIRDYMLPLTYCNQGPGAGEGIFSEANLATAYKRLKDCAFGIDGVSKRFAKPAVTGLLSEIESFSGIPHRLRSQK